MIVNVLKWDDSLQEKLTALFHTGESRGEVRAPPYFQAKLKPRGPRKIIFSAGPPSFLHGMAPSRIHLCSTRYYARLIDTTLRLNDC